MVFSPGKQNDVNTMKFTDAVFMAVKRMITRFSWLFNDFLIKVAFIVIHDCNFSSIVFHRWLPNFLSHYGHYSHLIPYLQVSKQYITFWYK